jgi:hypothetical protein
MALISFVLTRTAPTVFLSTQLAPILTQAKFDLRLSPGIEISFVEREIYIDIHL